MSCHSVEVQITLFSYPCLKDPGSNININNLNMGQAKSESVVLTAGLVSVVLASLTTMFLVSIEIPDSIRVNEKFRIWIYLELLQFYSGVTIGNKSSLFWKRAPETVEFIWDQHRLLYSSFILDRKIFNWYDCVVWTGKFASYRWSKSPGSFKPILKLILQFL